MIRIGIDPDITKPGVAAMEDGQYTMIQSFSFIELQKYIFHAKHDQDIIFSVEDVGLSRPTYGHAGGPSRDRVSQNVGMCKAAFKIIVATLEDANRTFELVKPLAATSNVGVREFYRRAHKDAEYFKKFTGWPHRTNNDSRCAAMLLWRYHKSENGGV